MAKKPNLYALIKNVEAFVKSVPIDPDSTNYKSWIKDRAEMKKALKLIHLILLELDVAKPTELRLVCGQIPQKRALARLVRCLQIPLKQTFTASIICSKIPQKAAGPMFKA